MSNLYSQWFDKVSETSPFSPDCIQTKNVDSDFTKKRMRNSDGATAKRLKTGSESNTSDGGIASVDEHQDESWVDDLFHLVGDVDDHDPLPPVPAAPASSQLTTGFLHNVVGDVLAKLHEDEDDLLFGDFVGAMLPEATSSAPANAKMAPLPPPPQHLMTDSMSSSLTSAPHLAQESDSAGQTIDRLRKSHEPMLLTLTSFPFRVIYANDAFAKLTDKKNIIGDTFYSIFVQEGSKVPSIATCPTLLGKFDEDVVRVSSDTERNGTFCKIKVSPVQKNSNQPSLGIRYFAVTLKELKIQDENAPSIVYLPMPSGCMTIAR